MSRATAIIMVGAGILIAGTSGLCSLWFLANEIMFPETAIGGDWAASLMLVVVSGGLPFAIGVALVIGGRYEIRKARERDAD